MDSNMQTGEQKSKLVAGLLAIFVGYLGIHNFYLGYTTKAIIQVVGYVVGVILATIGTVFVIGFFLWIIPAGIAIWALVEGILIFTGGISCDANGIPLKD